MSRVENVWINTEGQTPIEVYEGRFWAWFDSEELDFSDEAQGFKSDSTLL